MELSSPRSTVTVIHRFAAAACVLAGMLATSAQGEVVPDRFDEGLHEQVNAAYSLTESRLTKLEAPADAAEPFSVVVPIEGVQATLRLHRHSVRSDEHFQVLLDRGNGVYEEFDPGEPMTLRGTIDELPGARVAGLLAPEGLYATVSVDGAEYWVEPILQHVPGAEPGEHVVYRRDHVISEAVSCGVVAHVPAMDGLRAASRGSQIREAELAFDADWEYYNDFNQSESSVTSRIEFLTNAINSNQYENQCGIHHTITTIIIRTTSSDPYTSSDAGTLLNQFRSHWNTQQGGIPRDLAHLWTGRSLNSSTIGVAFLGVVCTSSAYGLSENYTGNTSCLSDLMAHEIGHNWSAPHCDPCSTTMRSSITCANTFTQSSINFIVNHRDSRSCLGLFTPNPPGAFTLNSPADGATGVSENPTFTWSSADGAQNYNIQVDDDSDFSSPLVNLTTGLTSYSATGLSMATEYYWKVVANNSAGQTASTPPVASFITFGPEPGFFVLVEPSDGATIDTLEPTFQWSESSDSDGYLLEVDNDSDFSSPEISASSGFTVDAGVVSWDTPPGELADGEMYNWRVTATNIVGATTAANGPFEFSVALPTGCEGDVDGSNVVDVNDVSFVIFRLGDTGTPGEVDGDADGNGVVDANDISFVIFRLGPC